MEHHWFLRTISVSLIKNSFKAPLIYIFTSTMDQITLLLLTYQPRETYLII